MRIKEISVSRLFGLFDHVVPMKVSDRVTIITSPNGYGKTTLLRMVDSLVSGRYSELRKIPFRDFRIEFEDNHALQVIRVDAPHAGRQHSGADLHVALFRGQKKVDQATLPGLPPEAFNFPPTMVERAIPFLTKIGPSLWRDQRTGEEVDFEDVFRNYRHVFTHSVDKTSYSEPPWLTEFRKKVRVRFIEVQRLLRVGKGGNHREDDDAPVRAAVAVYSSDLSKLIKAKLAEYATLSQSLDRSFPKRLVEQTGRSARQQLSVERLKERLTKLENTRVSLTQAGLLDKEDERFEVPSDLTDPTLTGSVLPLYAEDAEQKLKVFEDISAKIELLTNIVNAHFQFKVLSIEKEKGFVFATNYPGTANKPRPLPPTRLSSGEQHMLVLIYELLFTVPRNSLVMIDEPEISLHVTWQLEFLRDIQRITELTGIDVLIATHAPGIINDRLDLTVPLEAPTVVG